jgi:fructokinase
MIATLGEALVDLVQEPDGRFAPVLGGSVFNVSLGLARQGVATIYLNPLSSDAFGDRFATASREAGVALAARRRSARPTSLAVVSIDEKGSPSYAFHREGVADRDTAVADLVACLPAAPSLLYSGGLALVPDDLARTAAVADAARERGALVSLDANVRLAATAEPERYLAGVWGALCRAHLVKASLEDLRALGRGGDPAAAAAELIAGGTTRLVALTFGEGGAALFGSSASVRRPAPRDLAIVDTVGAGDCFFAGLLSWLHRVGRLRPGGLDGLGEAELVPALDHAIASASLDLLRKGCSPPTWPEAEAFARAMRPAEGVAGAPAGRGRRLRRRR